MAGYSFSGVEPMGSNIVNPTDFSSAYQTNTGTQQAAVMGNFQGPDMAPLNNLSGVTTPEVSVPNAGANTGGAGAGGGGFFKPGGGATLALGAIQTLGSLWNSYNQNKMAKEQMKFQKYAFGENLRIKKKEYNDYSRDVTQNRAEFSGGNANRTSDATMAEVSRRQI